MKYFFSILILAPLFCSAQTISYEDSVNSFIKKYVADHEVVKGNDKKMMQFYPVNEQYRVTATFERKDSSEWFLMPTSGVIKKEYRVFGIFSFSINDTAVKLNVYQSKQLMASEEYFDYLFIPFTDKTSGIDTYGGGRYIDLKMNDIKNDRYIIDFNKAYNPYCAYAAGYNCPIPPKENDLPVTVKAGEKNYAGH
jgi:uncharacterized protein (DUF1684 family)